ncbi:MAG: hypothetical protein ACI9KE_000504 [Polyangiales bacterium]
MSLVYETSLPFAGGFFHGNSIDDRRPIFAAKRAT